MDIKTNPAARNFRQAILGFEVTHVIGAVLSSCIVNTALGVLGAAQWPSIALGVIVLVFLRVLSGGQKPGHLKFLALWLSRPHLYLGHGSRHQKEEPHHE